jgi:hypothetical protein
MSESSSKKQATALVSVLEHLQTPEDDVRSGPDLEYAIHNGQRLVHRIYPFSLDQETLMSGTSDEAVITQSNPGRLNTLIWSTRPPSLLQDDEIEVEVHVSGLDFRNVLVGMQIIPTPNPTFGYEAAGIFRKIGSAVSRLAVGDCVIGACMNTSATREVSESLLHKFRVCLVPRCTPPFAVRRRCST